MSPEREDGAPWRNFYGRRHGKTLRKGHAALLETRLGDLSLPGVGWDENPNRTAIDPSALIPGTRGTWLEIGFGSGEHMLAEAEANPEIGILGCEAFMNGVATLLAHIERAGTGNIRLHPGDARDLMDVLPPASLARVYLLYPDPWPKKRHWKRRFVGPDNLDQIARVMAPGAELRIATDIPDYVRHTLEHLIPDPRFDWLARGPSDWRQPWPGWPSTRYEQKALREGRVPHYLRFRRV
ncbi:MAG: tRNA (guanosine(46)-N7)-methyltransferase TrmB [Pseudomonadota bacterium]